jgi:phosphoribosyl-ATP pyrophosphohydrolase
MVKADFKNEIIELDGDLDELWKDIYEILSCIYSLTEFCEGKRSLSEHQQTIEEKYREERPELLKGLFEVEHDNLIQEQNDLLYNG